MEEITIKILNTVNKATEPQPSLITLPQITLEEKTNQHYQSFLNDLDFNIKRKHYRKVLYEIEAYTHKDNYSLSIYHFRLLHLKSKCIIRILSKKLNSLQIEDNQDISLKQRDSIKFWSNQLYFLITHLIAVLTTNTDNMHTIDNETSMNQIEQTIEIILTALYLLSLYSSSTKAIQEVSVYIGIADRFNSFILNYARNPKTYHIYQKLQFIKVNLLIANNELDNVLKCIERTIAICFKQMFLMTNLEEQLTIGRLEACTDYKELIYHNIVNLIISLMQRSMFYEKTGKIMKSIQSYREILLICDNCLIEKYPQLISFIEKVKARSAVYHSVINEIGECVRVLLLNKQSRRDKEESKIMHHHNKVIIRSNSGSNKERLQVIVNSNSGCNSNDNSNKLLTTASMNKALHLIDKLDLGEYDSSINDKTQNLTSTVKLIDQLMSEDFEPFLMKMKKIEVNHFDKDTFFQMQKYIKSLDIIRESKEKSTKRLIGLSSSNNISQYPLSQSNTNTNTKPIGVSRPISLKHNNTSNKVMRIKIDGKAFKTSYLQRKTYLEKYSQKELAFHKKLLYLKKFEKESSTLRFNSTNIRGQAEDFYHSKLSLFKSSGNNSTLHKLIVKKIADAKAQPKKMNYSQSCGSIYQTQYNALDQKKKSKTNTAKPLYDSKEANEHNKRVLKQLTEDYDRISYLKKHIETKQSKLKLNSLNRTTMH